MIQVAVLLGGRSPEHAVSVRSGLQVLRHMDRTRYAAWPVFLDMDGFWWPAREPCTEVPASGQDIMDHAVSALRPGAALEYMITRCGVDVVFPALHGKYGEDGTVQGMLELHGVPCVGSGCAASAVAMDKIRTRECLTAHHLPMAEAYVFSRPQHEADAGLQAHRIEEHIGFPCFVKVDLSGSTIGVQKVSDPGELMNFLESHRTKGRRFLAERPIEGEEITVPVLGNCDDVLQALPPVGIYPIGQPYFTHDAKYDETACDEVVPPRGLSTEMIKVVQDLALQCHMALQCDGMSRTDMIVGAAGPVILEVNTIPGLTTASLLPRSAAHMGLSFGGLLTRLLELAMKRQAHREPVA